ncbi:hypothetical protein [Actinomycetospora cinnamomea]|nr:hypothetical protein [Actinomycetospora cinnamomea]
MPGWRAYLPDNLDRAARRSDRRAAALLRPVSRRVVAAGALAACALAGGAVVHTRSSGPSETSPGSAEDAASVLARSSAWTREAMPVLASVETELRRADEVRQRWEASSLARRAGPPPGPVLALVERRAELARHRDALRAAMTAIRSAPASEAALVSAWPQLRAAQEMLQALVAGRGELGDPVEATVLRLVLDEGPAARSAGGPPPGRGEPRAPRGIDDTATVALAAVSARLADRPVASRSADVPEVVTAARERPARAATTTGTRSDAVERPSESDDAGSPESPEVPEATGSSSSAPSLAAPPAAPATDEPERRAEDPDARAATPSSPTPLSADPTMLTFDRPSSDAADAEQVGEEATSPLPAVPTDGDTGDGDTGDEDTGDADTDDEATAPSGAPTGTPSDAPTDDL